MAKTENSKKNGYIDSQPDMENDNSIYAYSNLSVNKDGIIVYANGDVSRILGYSRQELIGTEAAKFYFKPSESKKFKKAPSYVLTKIEGRFFTEGTDEE